MTVAQAIVRYLANQVVRRDETEQRLFAGMFGIFGHGNVTGLGQALEEVGHDLPYFQPKNEQAMVHTAIAYAKLKNRLQTFACTSSIGPGATNMVTGAATATLNRLPVLLLPGDIFATRLPHPVLQGLEHPHSQDVSVNDAFRPVSRYWDRINRPEQLLAALPEAVRVLTDPAETGAVTLALPQDVQTESYDFPARFFERRVWRIGRTLPPASELAEAVAWIRAAKRPLIVAGGGVIYSAASGELDAFVKAFGVPSAETQAGKGALPWNHPQNAGPLGSNGGLAANRLAAQADLVIALGTRLSDFTSASKSAFQHPNVRFIGINVSAFDAAKFGALALVGDARATLHVLAEALGSAGYRTEPAYAAQLAAWKGEWDAAVDAQRAIADPAHLTQANVIGLVNDAAGERDVVICAAGGMPGDLLKLWRPLDPKSYHLEYGYSCMGYEIAGGLGAKLADPSREVFVMVGDGSYLMLHTELVTAVQEGVKLIVVVVDNHGYQCIHGLQNASGSPSFGNEFRQRAPGNGRLEGEFVTVDFVANAKSLGAEGLAARDARELRAALEAAKASPRTTVIHVQVPADVRVPGYESWWDVPIAEVSKQEGVRQARAEYVAAKARQRRF